MSYSIRGLIILQTEEAICITRQWPSVSLNAGLALVPIANRPFLFLLEGSDTEPSDSLDVIPPEWLTEMANSFSVAVYIEAEFWGGSGMQAACVWKNGRIQGRPFTSSGAINSVLQEFGVDESPPPTPPTTFLASIFAYESSRGDLFELVGLGKNRSTDAWLEDALKRKKS